MPSGVEVGRQCLAGIFWTTMSSTSVTSITKPHKDSSTELNRTLTTKISIIKKSLYQPVSSRTSASTTTPKSMPWNSPIQTDSLEEQSIINMFDPSIASTTVAITENSPKQPKVCYRNIFLSNLTTLNAVFLISDIYTLKKIIFQPGERIRYECAKNYRLFNGTLDQVCGPDGNWKRERSYCTRCTCPCSRMKNQASVKTSQDLQNKIDNITKQLRLKKSDLSSRKRKKISAADSRPSARTVGSILGIAILAFILMVIILSDIPKMYRQIRYGPYA